MRKSVMWLIVLLMSMMLTGCGGAEKPNSVLVFIDNGARQCEFAGNPPQHTADVLSASGIEVLSSECGFRTGLFFPAVCSAGNAEINLHGINETDLSMAAELGFLPVSGLAGDADKGYEIVECP